MWVLTMAQTMVGGTQTGNYPACTSINVLELCAFLKAHGLPGAE